jgi:hypothetical protein
MGSGDATLANNVIATLSANVNVPVRMSGGTSVDLINNFLDPDFHVLGMPPPAGTVYKWGIYADRIGGGALRAYNNLILIRRDDPFDNPSQRLAVYEVAATGTSSNLGALDHNLFYIDGDLLSTTDAPPYVRVSDGTSTAEYPAADVNTVAGITTNAGNLVDLPLLDEPGGPLGKTQIRSLPGSPVEDAGNDSVAPPDDIDGETRTAPVDIGHDEI